MGYKLTELRGVPASLAKSLATLGISDSEQYLLAVSDPDELKVLASKLGISTQILTRLADRCDLLRVPGIGPAYTELLNGAGIKSVADLRAAGPGLFDQLMKAGETLGVKGLPKQSDVTAWVTAAGSMADVSDWAVATKSEALRAQFADDDWKKIQLAPLAAAALVVTASPSDKGDTAAELNASAAAVNSALAEARPEALLSVAFPGGVKAEDISKFMAETPRAAMLSTIKTATGLVRNNLDTEQLAAYQAMILNVAQTAAEAAKEGGFLGMGKKLISDEEQAALDEIDAAVGE
jgi:predicted flap endonuclease-1-like 5' DNA nuclease